MHPIETYIPYRKQLNPIHPIGNSLKEHHVLKYNA